MPIPDIVNQLLKAFDDHAAEPLVLINEFLCVLIKVCYHACLLWLCVFPFSFHMYVLLLQVSGVTELSNDSIVTIADLHAVDESDIIKKLNTLIEVNGTADYSLVSAANDKKRLIRRYSDFIMKFVSDCTGGSEIIYDDTLFSTLLDWFYRLSVYVPVSVLCCLHCSSSDFLFLVLSDNRSKFISLRHVAIFTAYQFSDAIIKQIKLVQKEMTTTSRQLQAASGSKNSEQNKKLKEKSDLLEHKIGVLNDYLTKVWNKYVVLVCVCAAVYFIFVVFYCYDDDGTAYLFIVIEMYDPLLENYPLVPSVSICMIVYNMCYRVPCSIMSFLYM